MEDELAPIVEAEATSKKKSPSQKKSKSATVRWQERLLPTMVNLLIGLTLFFFVTTLAQMAYLHWSILEYQALEVSPSLSGKLLENAITFEEIKSARETESMIEMEAYVIQRRYHHASVALMAGIWIRYLGFITGMILSLVGASFILGKLREPATELTGKASGVDFSLRSASPGIILAVLGVILMFTTIVNKDVYEVQDAPVYVNGLVQPISLDLSTPEPVATLEDLELIYGTPTQTFP